MRRPIKPTIKLTLLLTLWGCQPGGSATADGAALLDTGPATPDSHALSEASPADAEAHPDALLGVDAALSRCDGEWVDTNWDNDNCGACGAACSAKGAFCNAGVCICNSSTSGKIQCNGVCVDIMNDSQNCGACGAVCDAAAGSTCDQGKCSVCGDGAVTGEEQCDGSNLGGKTCTTAGFNGGAGLSCKDCKLVTNGCTCTHPAVVKSCKGGWCTIPAGCFQMGSPSGEACRDSDETQHQVAINHDFEIMEAEVTQAQFEALLGYKVVGWIADCSDCPVTPWWYSAAAYCNALSKSKGLTPCYWCPGGEQQPGSNCKTKATIACPGYRLPTEAEWEYAYRAGTQTAYYAGPNDPTQCAGVDPVASAIGWYDGNSGGKRQPVKGKQPNAWGLYDMAGNVWEWMEDGYEQWGSTPVTDPLGGAGKKVIRGGCHFKGAKTLRAAERESLSAGWSSSWVGFRCARTLAP